MGLVSAPDILSKMEQGRYNIRISTLIAMKHILLKDYGAASDPRALGQEEIRDTQDSQGVCIEILRPRDLWGNLLPDA